MIFLFLLFPVQGAESVNIYLEIPPLQQLTLDTLSVSLGSIQPQDLDLGYLEKLNATSVTVKSNADWILYLRTDEANLGTAAGYTKPLEDFQWRISGGSYQSISQTNTLLKTGSAGAYPNAAQLDYKMLLNWNNPAGSYGLMVIFTLSSP